MTLYVSIGLEYYQINNKNSFQEINTTHLQHQNLLLITTPLRAPTLSILLRTCFDDLLPFPSQQQSYLIG